jgi:hypothetical protein
MVSRDGPLLRVKFRESEGLWNGFVVDDDGRSRQGLIGSRRLRSDRGGEKSQDNERKPQLEHQNFNCKPS